MIYSDAFPVVRLEKIFRQAAESDIIMNAHRINAGEMVEPRPGSRDFLFIKRDNPGNIIGRDNHAFKGQASQLCKQQYT